ncbi:MAG: class I SAM-dependent methyltransferase [Candidatus Lutacidiplasmatales archaeon]
MGREWKRYEGTAQRELFRSLRTRFLLRHSGSGGTVLEVGSGPGRFLPHLGAPQSRRVALDLSQEMLREIPAHWPTLATAGPLPDRIRGDGMRPPFRPGSFEVVAALGNAIGFSGASAPSFLSVLAALVRPGGFLVLETVAGPGEASNYLSRLPPGAVRRLLRSPLSAVKARIESEGFRPESPRERASESFRRLDAHAVHDALKASGLEPIETMAVAPLTGPLAERISAVREDASAWGRLFELEESIGRSADRWRFAAALLVAAHRPGGPVHGS